MSTATRRAYSMLTSVLAAGALGLAVLTPQPAGASDPIALAPPPAAPTLVAADVTQVLLPTQDLSTYKFSSYRKHGVLRTIWDVVAGTDTTSFRASTVLASVRYCNTIGECVGSSTGRLFLSSPSTSQPTCARAVHGLRVTLSCPIEMRKYQTTGNYASSRVYAAWEATGGGSETGEQSYDTDLLTSRIRNASKLSLHVRSYVDGSGVSRTRLTGLLRWMTLNPTTGSASFTRYPDQTKVAIFYLASGQTVPKFIGHAMSTSTGYGRTLAYRPKGRWIVKFAGTTYAAQSGASGNADPIDPVLDGHLRSAN